jgi:rhodanese-related sulfurtransferase
VPTIVDRDQVLELVERRWAQVVEVLPRREYDEEHLPDAIHLPLKALDACAVEVLDRGRPVIVYCWDGL